MTGLRVSSRRFGLVLEIVVDLQFRSKYGLSAVSNGDYFNQVACLDIIQQVVTYHQRSRSWNRKRLTLASQIRKLTKIPAGFANGVYEIARRSWASKTEIVSFGSKIARSLLR